MKQKFILVILVVGVLTLTGCSNEVKQIGDLTKKASQDLDATRMKARDAKRIADARILSTGIQLYALDAESLPTAKDDKGNFRAMKLIKGSADYTLLESTLKSKDSTSYLPSDPAEPERYFEYFSDGKIYTIKTPLEQSGIENCKQIKPGFCEFEVKGDLDSVLK